MNKIPAVIILLLLFITSCKQTNLNKEYLDTWIEVEKTNSTYHIVDCGYSGESIIVLKDSIIHKGIMEDYKFNINRTTQENDKTSLFTGEDGKSFYKFSWADQEKGICKWEIKSEDKTVIKYFVRQSDAKNIKTVKGINCITNEDVGDTVNDSLAIGDGTKILTIEDNNCIVIRNKKEEVLFDTCFENMTVKIRHTKGGFLPLTFISGTKSIDVDFHSEGKEWMSKKATYYSSNGSGDEVKKENTLTTSLKDFDFEAIAIRFDNMDDGVPIKVADLQNPEEILDQNIYGIADLLNANPVSHDNLKNYYDAALSLTKAEKYNEARIILLEMVKLSPKQAQYLLALGDAQWGFDNKEEAVRSYQQYIIFSGSSKSAPTIPQRVEDRIKQIADKAMSN